MSKKLPPLIYDPPFGIVRNSGIQSIPNAVVTTLQFNTVIASNGIPYDIVNNWFTIPSSGLYGINAFYQAAANGVGVRSIFIYLNGNSIFSRAVAVSNINGGNNIEISVLDRLTAGDTLQIRVGQTSGAALNTALVGNMSDFSVIGHITD